MRWRASPLRRNRTISLDPNLPGQNFERDSLDVDSKLFSKVQIDSKEDWARIKGKIRRTSQSVTRTHKFTFSLAAFSAGPPPCSAASFEVNSEPHTGARPSVRLCVGLTTRRQPFSSPSKPIDLGLGFHVHWVHMQLGSPPSSLVGTLNVRKHRETP
jgi:hypothetical protein